MREEVWNKRNNVLTIVHTTPDLPLNFNMGNSQPVLVEDCTSGTLAVAWSQNCGGRATTMVWKDGDPNPIVEPVAQWGYISAQQ
jgi:hypothetical protein